MTSRETIIDYYADIMPDHEGWRQCLDAPLPTTFWVNTLKISPDQCIALLKADGIEVEPMTWCEHGFRYFGDKQLGNTWQYQIGLIHIQEEVSMLAGVLLNAKPHERVIDLCSAPGGKTVQLACSMQNSGTVIANDRNMNRMSALSNTTKRLGLMNIAQTIYDATSYPRMRDVFDKVMCDVPCRCEGTLRKNIRKFVPPSREKSQQQARTQYAILEKALQLCKPGGEIIYSTCTFAPEENEAVVSRLLKAHAGEVEAVSIHLSRPSLKGASWDQMVGYTTPLSKGANHLAPGPARGRDAFNHSPGITQWQGDSYHPDVAKAMRIWPQQNNTGGFFICRLKKTADNCALSQPSAKHASCDQIFKPNLEQNNVQHLTQNSVIAESFQRFNITPEQLTHTVFEHASSKGVYATNCDMQLLETLNYDVIGLFALKTNMQFPKISTAFAPFLGAHATQNCFALSDEQFALYRARKDLDVTDAQAAQCTSTGYVLLKYQDLTVGLGLYFSPNEHHGHVLRSLWPGR